MVDDDTGQFEITDLASGTETAFLLLDRFLSVSVGVNLYNIDFNRDHSICITRFRFRPSVGYSRLGPPSPPPHSVGATYLSVDQFVSGYLFACEKNYF